MAQIRPFCGLRPLPEFAQEIASVPYDVLDVKEAAKEIRRKGETSAQKLIQEADAKAAQLIERAKVEAAKLDQQ